MILRTRCLGKEEAIPYELLLFADETRQAIDRYIYDSDLYVIEEERTVVAVYALCALNGTVIEIKNIAVAPALQGRSIGRFLLEDAARRATEAGYREIIVGTPDSASRLLGFYEQAGFIRYEKKVSFYLENYPDPIIEEGVQLRDMMMLKKILVH